MPEIEKPGKLGWWMFVVFVSIVLAIVIIGTRLTCPNIENDMKEAMLRSEPQQVGVFKISKTEDGKNLITLGE